MQLARPTDRLKFHFRLLRAGFSLDNMDDLIRWGQVTQQKGYVRMEGQEGRSAWVMYPVA